MTGPEKEQETSIKEIQKDSEAIIVSFGGKLKQFGRILPFEFLNFLDAHYPDTSKLFIIDKTQNSYHSGLEGITTTIDDTVEFLREKIKPYKYVYFLGVSSGGYAAILFGSLLKVTAVIAFIPQTLLTSRPNKNPAYIDLAPLINKETHYHLCADNNPVMSTTDPHHMSHCIRISNHPNVHVQFKNPVHLPDMRNSGELFQIINNCII